MTKHETKFLFIQLEILVGYLTHDHASISNLIQNWPEFRVKIISLVDLGLKISNVIFVFALYCYPLIFSPSCKAHCEMITWFQRYDFFFSIITLAHRKQTKCDLKDVSDIEKKMKKSI